jgi:cytidylate kinase
MAWKIAIDGPAGAGKSTVAKIIANQLNGEYLDTGAMYRAIALKSIRVGVDFSDLSAITDDDFEFVNSTDVVFSGGDIYLDGECVSDLIRTPDMSSKASFVSKFGVVRTRLVYLQQLMAKSINVVMDGRDIGTVVLPDADLKIFLIASPVVRAERRQKQLIEKSGSAPDLDTIIQEINARDLQDSTRAISPLKKADDAVEIDSSYLSIDEVVQKILCLFKERGLIMEDVKTLNEETKDAEVKEEAVEQEEKVESVEESSQETEAKSEEKAEAKAEAKADAKEMQTVEGVVVEVQQSEPEKTNKNGEVVKKAREARVLVKLDNDQEGFLYMKEIADCESEEDLFFNYVPGDRVKLVVKKVYEDGGKLLLSQILLAKKESLKDFQKVIDDHGTFTAKVVKLIKVGLILEYNGYSCLLPTSQVNAKEEELEGLVGTEMEVAPIRVDLNRIRLIVSQNVANAIKAREEKSVYIASLKVGDVVKGTVKKLEEYGAFVELEHGVEGLLHVSEIEHNRVVKIEKVLNVGDAVECKIIKLDEKHIGLSRKALLPNYWKDFIDSAKVGDEVEGEIAEINKFGVVINLATEIQGFLPKSEFAYERDVQVEDFYKVGDSIKTMIIQLDSSKKRVILSKKQLPDNPWNTVQLNTGDVVKCVTLKQLPTGVKFTTLGITGFLNAVNYGDKTEFEPGDEFEAKVRLYDPKQYRLTVTVKEPRPREERIRRSNDVSEMSKYLRNQEKMNATFADFLDKDEK